MKSVLDVSFKGSRVPLYLFKGLKGIQADKSWNYTNEVPFMGLEKTGRGMFG